MWRTRARRGLLGEIITESLWLREGGDSEGFALGPPCLCICGLINLPFMSTAQHSTNASTLFISSFPLACFASQDVTHAQRTARFYLAVVYFRHFRKKKAQRNQQNHVHRQQALTICVFACLTHFGKNISQWRTSGDLHWVQKCFWTKCNFSLFLIFSSSSIPRSPSVKVFNEVRCERAIFIFNFFIFIYFFCCCCYLIFISVFILLPVHTSRVS